MSGWVRSEQDKSGQFTSCQVRSSQAMVRSGEFGQVISGQVRFGKVRLC